MAEWQRVLRRYADKVLPYLKVARLWPLDLPLLPLLPLLTALPLAGGGHLDQGAAWATLLGAVLVWGMAWSYFDLLESERTDKADSLIARGLLSRQRSFWLGAVLGVLALLDALLLGGKTVVLAVIVAVLVAAYPWLRRRSFLADGWFAIALAMTVLFAYSAQGVWPDQLAVLLALSSLFWVIGWSVLSGWPQQQVLAARGVYTLGQMFGPLTGWLVSGLQLTALLGWWMVGQHAKLGGGYQAGLLVAFGLVVMQGFLLQREGSEGCRSAQSLHLVIGAVIWLVVLGPTLV